MSMKVAVLMLTLLQPVGAWGKDAASGEALFRRYCATCHGLAAKGNGPTAEIISVAPTDLTRLASENGGAFPLERIVRRIDGRDMIVAHGSPMPIYGAFFEDAEQVRVQEGEDWIEASPPVIAIAHFLQAIQQE